MDRIRFIKCIEERLKKINRIGIFVKTYLNDISDKVIFNPKSNPNFQKELKSFYLRTDRKMEEYLR